MKLFQTVVLIAACSLVGHERHAVSNEPIVLAQLPVTQPAATQPESGDVSPAESRAAEKRLAIAGVTSWLVSHVPLTPDEERQRARALQRQVETKHNTLPCPRSINAVLDRLVKQLPQEMRRPGDGYEVRVLDCDDITAFTVGGGVIYLSDAYLNALTADANQRDDRLAFVLAGQLGHLCRGHCRFAFQLDDLRVALDDRANRRNSQLLRAALRSTVDLTEEQVSLVVLPRQINQADLFALHLCRNSGFDVGAAIGALQPLATVVNRKSVDPTHRDTAVSLQDRKVNLRAEIDGLLPAESADYGLREYRDGGFQALGRLPVKAGERAIVFVHGMESGLPVFRNFARSLAKGSEIKGVRILGFQYPNDMSLSRAGIAMHREIRKICQPNSELIFICHSAGGLVFRYYSQVLGGEFAHAVFLGTPHHGSNLTALRDLLELRQLTGGVLKFQYSSRFENVVRDGNGQIGFDLTPDSLFLRYLDRHKFDASRCCVQRGRVFSPFKAATLQLAVSAGRTALQKQLAKKEDPDALSGIWAELLEQVDLPPEVTRGDLAVSLASATLKGAEAKTYECSHFRLPKDPQVMADSIQYISKKLDRNSRRD
ncbi:MAG: M48 family metalloprotease [Planctomycetota bacterium]|nr:M48 family metalloprotease [Planctomycetota bacterium]